MTRRPCRPMMRIVFAVAMAVLSPGCAMTDHKHQASEPPDFMKLWDYSAPAETERRFRELLPEAEASRDPSYLGALRTQIARTYSLRSMFDQAHAELDRVEPLLEAGGPALRVRYLLERGRAYNSAGLKDRARPLFLEAWDLGVEAGVTDLAVDAAHMIAIVEPPDAALAWNLRALELVESTDDKRVRGWLGPLYNNIGWTYFDRGELDAALRYLDKGLAFRVERGQVAETRIAKWSVARVYREIGRTDEALQIQMALERETREAGDEPSGYVQEELGECLLILGKKDQAKSHFARAYELLSKDDWLIKNEPDRIARLKTLGGR